MTESFTEGWWNPRPMSMASKWHYFINGRSLCGKWMTLGKTKLEQGNDESPDNCAACRERKAKRHFTKEPIAILPETSEKGIDSPSTVCLNVNKPETE